MSDSTNEVRFDRYSNGAFMGRYTIQETAQDMSEYGAMIAGDKFVVVRVDEPVPNEGDPMPKGW